MFRDVDAMPAGANFVQFVKETLTRCRSFILIISPNWMVDSHGRRLTDNPNDYVRFEIRSALAKKTHVIPVTLEGTKMPMDQELPDDISEIATLHAVPVADGGRFEHDIDRLIKAIETSPPLADPEPEVKAAPEDPPSPGPPKKPRKPVSIPLGRSYLSVVLCLPLGALAVTESMKCSEALGRHDDDAADTASKTAQKWNTLAILGSFAWWPFVFYMFCSAISK